MFMIFVYFQNMVATPGVDEEGDALARAEASLGTNEGLPRGAIRDDDVGRIAVYIATKD